MARSLDSTGKHLIRILRQGGRTARNITELWFARRNELIGKLNKFMRVNKNQFQIESFVHKEIARLSKDTSVMLESEGMISAEFQANSTAKYLSVLGVNNPNVYNVTQAFIRRSFKKPMPFQNIAVNDLLSGTMASLDVSLVNVTRTARSIGATTQSIAKFIEAASGALDDPAIRRKANALARTAISQVSNDVRFQSFVDENEVSGVLYIATLDHRTSNICKVLDGTYWPKKEEAKVPPIHVSCRSTLVPVLEGESLDDVKDQLSRPAVEIKSVRELEAKGLKTSGGRVRKPSRTDRSPLRGVTKSEFVTYEQWIKEQPVAYQKEILGPKAFNKLRDTGSLRKSLGVLE